MNEPKDPNAQSDKEIFFAALEQPNAEARAAFLSGACGKNIVRRRHIDKLLADHFEQDSFLQTAAVDVPPTVLDTPPVLEGPGAEICRYKLLQKLGEGGFGVVYMAEQMEPVKRRVALKIIKLGMDTKQVVARFEAERQALAMMDHPNIAKVLDGGATETGRPFFVMELVRGIPITKYCDDNQLTTKERLNLFTLVCHAIQHAHQKGIIHRDIKPSNIMITLHDGVPVPKVIDFGIAKATQQELTEKTIFTQYSQFIGTPAYMSPEQAEMSGLDIDTRSDIYSLGVVLYELLVGRTPLDTKELMSGGLDEIRKCIREEEPSKPSTRMNTLEGSERTTVAKQRKTREDRLSGELRGDLDWVVMKSLEKDRTRRYETATGFALDIKRYLSDEPVLARAPSTLYQIQKFWLRNRIACSAAAAVTLALTSGLWISLSKTRIANQATAELSEKVIALEEAERVAVVAKEASDQNRETAIRNLYSSNVYAAQSHIENGNFNAARHLLDSLRPDSLGVDEDMRGWEWRYLYDQLKGDHIGVMTQHDAGITAMALSRDERHLLFGDENGNILVWHLEERRLVRRIPIGGGTVYDLDFSPTGKIVRVPESSLTSRFFRYDPITADLSALGEIEACAGFLPGSDRIVSVTDDASIVIKDLDTGSVQPLMNQTLDARLTERFSSGSITSFALSDGGSQLAALDEDGWIGVINLEDGTLVERLSLLESGLTSVQYQRNGPVIRFLPGSNEHLLTYLLADAVAWKVTALGVERVKTLGGPNIWKVKPVPGTSMFLLADQLHAVQVWDSRSMERVALLRGHRDEVWAVAGTSDGRIFSGSWDRQVLEWSLSETSEHRNFDFDGWLLPVFSPDGKEFATMPAEGFPAIIDIGTGARRELPTIGWPFGYSADGETLYLSEFLPEDHSRAPYFSSGRVIPVDAARGQIRSEPLLRSMGACRFAVHHGGSMVSIYSRDTQEQHFIDLETGESKFVLTNPFENWRPSIALSPNAERFALWPSSVGGGIPDPVLEIYDVTNSLPEKLTTLKHDFKRQILDAKFSPNGKILAVGGADGTIQVWNTEDWSPRDYRVMDGHRRGVLRLAFAHDSRTLASAGDDGLVNLWNVDNGGLMVSLKVGGRVPRLGFSPNRRTLVVASGVNGSRVDRLQFFEAPSLESFDSGRD